ncbi:MAG: sensor histidine kinase [Anaerolineae bacterium]|nr:sensor histidine kinase [Anaerolineae bacterium]
MSEIKSHQRDWGPTLVGYFTLIAVAAGAIVSLQEDAPTGLVVLNFILIAVLMAFEVDDLPLLGRVIYLGAFTLLTSLFFFLGVHPGLYQVLFFVISAQAMMMLPLGGGLLWVLLLTAISGAAFWIVEGFATGILTMLVYSGGYLFFGIFGRSLLQAQEAQRRSDELLEELQQAHAKLQEYVLQVEQLAVAEERNRLAREMHDAIGHRLTVSAVQLEGAQRLVTKEPGRAEEMVATVREQVREALAELRQTVATLRSPLESGLDLSQSLRRLIHEFEQATEISVNLLITDDFPPLPDSHRQTLYRTAQEALTNVQRHTIAKQVWLQVKAAPQAVKLTIGDDGGGFNDGDEDKGFGLRGMRERAALLGGECYIDARPGGGGQITIILPLEANSDGS